MYIELISPKSNLSDVVNVLNKSHGTVAKKFGFTKESNPSNNAFIKAAELKEQLNMGIDLYALSIKGKTIGCVAIEKSKSTANTYYIEKVSVLPENRNSGYGVKLMDFAIDKIASLGGKNVSIALIDEFTELKNWYLKQGFKITGTKNFEHLPFNVCFMAKKIEQ